jgi:hypothetical protein
MGIFFLKKERSLKEIKRIEEIKRIKEEEMEEGAFFHFLDRRAFIPFTLLPLHPFTVDRSPFPLRKKIA